MAELKRIGKRTYYVTGLFHVGVYLLHEDAACMGNRPVCLIDSGVDEDAAREIDDALEKMHFTVKMIINSHYHADHSGGNAYFKDKYHCITAATAINALLISNYDVCPAMVWGASPLNEIMNNYFYTEPSDTCCIDDVGIPEGIEIVQLPGHCISMIGVRTDDDVVFVGDAVIGEDTLAHHSLSYIYEIGSYLESLERLERMKAALFVPYHAKPTDDIVSLVEANRRSVMNNIAAIKDICAVPRSLDEVYSMIYNRCGYKTNLYRYAVESAIIRTYLSYLYNCGEMQTIVENNFVKWYVPDGI